MDLKGIAVGVIDKEAKAVEKLKPYVDDEFVEILNLIFSSKGRLVITGIGKSAIIEGLCQLIVSENALEAAPKVFIQYVLDRMEK